MSDNFDDEAASLQYNRRLGARLREIRRQKGLSLQEVEADSKAEFKASVVGAYERGERAVSVPRLERLARYYDVPIDHLLPRDPAAINTDLSTPEGGAVIVDLVKLAAMRDEAGDRLRRFFRMVELERQDYNGKMLTVRNDDRRVLAMILDVPTDQVTSTLNDYGLLYRPAASAAS